MNREETKECIVVMQAWIDGGHVQHSTRDDSSRWYTVRGCPVWSWGSDEYRIKPKPREWEVLVDELKYILTVRQDGEGERNWIKVREVIE